MLIYFIFIFLLLLLIYYNIYSFINNKYNIKYKYVFITGSSENHEICMLNLLLSVLRYHNEFLFCIWDLGLSKEMIKYFKRLEKEYNMIKIFKFNYDNYPSYVNINKNFGEYAWKPIIIKKSYYYFKRPIIWLDAGCIITGSINCIIKYIKEKDVWSTYAKHSIRKYTHIGTINYFNIDYNLLWNKCCSAGTIAFMYPSKLARIIIDRWYKCAIIKECLAPRGSNKWNHRQDQTAFSIIVNLYGRKEICDKIGYNVSIHRDDNINENNKFNLMKYFERIISKL